MVRQYLAPCLVAGYESVTTEFIESVAKDSTRAAGVSIVDVTPLTNRNLAVLRASASRPTTPPSATYRGTPTPSVNSDSPGSSIIVVTPTSTVSPANTVATISPAPPAKSDEPVGHFLRIDFQPDKTGLHLNLLLKLEDICDFIDQHLGTFPTKHEALAEQEAAIGFGESDDDIFCGESVMSVTNESPILPSGQLGCIVLIHGGETKSTRYQPAFVGIAYLMRKWRKGLKETYLLASKYNAEQGGGRLELTPNQHQQLVLWEATGYRIMERGTLGGRFFKKEYLEYCRSGNKGN